MRCVLILASLIPFLALVDAKATPLEVNPTLVDFGILKEKKDREQIVYLENTGDRAITIQKLSIGCGCLNVTLLDDPTIRSRTTVRIRIALDATRLQVGVKKDALHIVTDDEHAPIIEVPVTYAFQPDVWLSTTELPLAVDKSRNEVLAAGSVQLVNAWSQVLRLESIEASTPHLTYEIGEVRNVIEQGRAYITIHALMHSSAPPGSVEETLIVRTNHPEHSELRVRVYGRIPGPVTPSPRVILFHNVRAADVFERRVTLRSDSDISIGSITASPSISATVVDDTNPRAIVVEMTGRIGDMRADASGALSESVEIRITEPLEYTESLTVVGNVLP